MKTAFIVPFRDRGRDPLRFANLLVVTERLMSYDLGPVHVVSDGGVADQQFCRHAAYNTGTAQTDADILIYYESDMLIAATQLRDAISLAAHADGLVVPFTQYRYLSETDSQWVRVYATEPERCIPESVMNDGASIGAINVVSAESVRKVGRWDTGFTGNWYDDNAMERAFSVCCGKTRFIDGPAYHLYHLPGWKGDHLTSADREATERNRARWRKYQAARTAERIRELTAGGD